MTLLATAQDVGVKGRVAAIEQELIARGRRAVKQQRLVVDYNRIRWKLSFPLPIRRLPTPRYPLHPSWTGEYPWNTWLLWAVEDRLDALHWTWRWAGDRDCGDRAALELNALFDIPQWGYVCRIQGNRRPTLASRHAAAILLKAHRDWTGLDEASRNRLVRAAAAQCDEFMPWFDAERAAYDAPAAVIQHHRSLERVAANIALLHNINIAGTIGLALAAHVCGHPRTGAIDRHIRALVLAWLDVRHDGHTESLSYDGYILDAIATWLPLADEATRREVLAHDQFEEALAQSVYAAAPGDVLHVAELADTEAREMTYHASAHARCARFDHPFAARSRWYLERCRLDWLRTETLVAMRDLPRGTPPTPGPARFLYAVSLRTGWERDDVAVVMSASRSPMGHVHHDGGTIVLGRAGTWLIDDPGYQQYLKTSERHFTIGAVAHNGPLINDVAQTRSRSRVLACEQLADDVQHAAVDVTNGYDPPAGITLTQAVRSIWLIGRTLLVVADRVEGVGIERLTYHWHGHPSVGWAIENGHAALQQEDEPTLWMHCPHVELTDEHLGRLRGSRGQLTLRVRGDLPADGCCWWVLNFGEHSIGDALTRDHGALHVAGRRLTPAGTTPRIS